MDPEIRFLNKKEYELSKELWLECFEDDGRDFVDWYYAERTKPKYVLGAFNKDDPRPIGMMHLLPMDMRFEGRARSICFVSGVCTKPGLRGRGICGSLFERAFKHMEERGYEATVLQPFDTAFYERFGYKTFICRRETEASDERLKSVGRTAESVVPNPLRLAGVYRRAMRSFNGCSVRGVSYFRSFIKEYSLSGAVLNCTENGCCAGYAEGEHGEVFRATELFCIEGADPMSLLPRGFCKYVFPLPEWATAPENSVSSIVPFSMIKPLRSDVDFFKGPAFGFDRY